MSTPEATAFPSAESAGQAPHPGSQKMPRWNLGELADAPRFTWKNWAMLLGPGLLTGGSAIGGGEWLTGPIVTAQYGGGLLWLATLSILGQVIYNIEISRYTLYTGEPIFTGKFRSLPGPGFWLFVYLILDFGSVFPYLAANAATPLAAVILGRIPDPKTGTGVLHLLGSEIAFDDKTLLFVLSYVIFFSALVPLIFGGKIYNALKAVMTFKIVVVLGFLAVLAVFHSGWGTWTEIFSGFVKFGNVPVHAAEDKNGNGRLDPGEDWDGDGRLDVVEPLLALVHDADGDGKPDSTDVDRDGRPDAMVIVKRGERELRWPDLDGDGQPDSTVLIDISGDGRPEGPFPLVARLDGSRIFVDVDGDGKQDGDNLDNLFIAMAEGRPGPKIDWTIVGFLCALVAISGNGGLSNTPISNYTRDQGWGMGHLVGAIPSVIGGQNIELSHVGTVFAVNSETLPRWRRWYKHVCRDQLAVWMPACFFGLALPSMLSVQFLSRGSEVGNNWTAAGMTADAVRETVGGFLGSSYWYMTLFCGFMVLAPSMASSADGVIRRWVDVFWTASPTLRRLDPGNIRYVYFATLVAFAAFGAVMIYLGEPTTLLLVSTMIFNFALGFSCWHTLYLNIALLPRELRPNWFVRIALGSTGAFFWFIGTISAMQKFGLI